MSKDISSMYTKDRNKTKGRKGYYNFKREKDTIISPKDYGMFKQRKNTNKSVIVISRKSL